jgi:hypothetical protein
MTCTFTFDRVSAGQVAVIAIEIQVSFTLLLELVYVGKTVREYEEVELVYWSPYSTPPISKIKVGLLTDVVPTVTLST